MLRSTLARGTALLLGELGERLADRALLVELQALLEMALRLGDRGGVGLRLREDRRGAERDRGGGDCGEEATEAHRQNAVVIPTPPT